MPIALLITLVGVSLSGLLSSMVISQIQTTRSTSTRVQAVNAAQAGLDVALANIRAAYDAVGGDRRKLPCGPMSGTVDPANATDPARYEVTINYYRIDPSGYQNNAAAIAANRIACTAGSGTTSVPLYALLQARGTATGDRNHDGVLDPDAGPWRSLFATYTFATKDENLPGGPIQVVGTSYCVGVTSATPAAGHPVTTVPCDPLDAKNIWVYPKNLTLVLARTRTDTLPGGLCIHAAAQTDGSPITLQVCAAVTDKRQQWRYNTGPFSYEGTADGKTDSGFCWNVEPAGALHGNLVMRTGTNCSNGHSSGRSFVPSPMIGPGAAGADTGQLVNHAEIGRCLDVPRDDVTGELAFGTKAKSLITFPCKQAFSGSVHWNHKWSMPTFAAGAFTAAGRISVTPTYVPPEDPDPDDGIPYCMESPGPGGGQVWVDKCSAGGAKLNWTIYSRAPLIEDAFQVTDTYGNCLQSVGPAAPATLKLDGWSYVVTTACDGSELQKWNVPASWTNAPLKDLGEK
jgi:hypothetical protein